MSDSDHEKRKDAVVEFLSERPTNIPLSILGKKRTKEEMQHNLARNLLIGFLLLFIISLVAVYLFNATFCSNVKACGENFTNSKIIIETILDFGSPFIGIIIGFFFSEKFWHRNGDE